MIFDKSTLKKNGFLKKYIYSKNSEIIFYVFLSSLAVFLGFIRNLVYGSVLNPEEIGLYAIVITIASYGTLLQLGLMSGLTRELPVCLGKGEKEEASRLVGETTSITILTQGFFLCIYFLTIAHIEFDNELTKNAFFLAGLLVLPSQLISMAFLRLRSEQKTLSFSFLNFLNTFLVVTIGYLMLPFFNFQGAVWTLILVNLVSFFVVTIYFLPKVNYFYFNKKDIFYLLKIGFPAMISGLLVTLYLSMDKLFLIKNSTLDNIGIYQIAFLPIILGVSLQSIINQFVGPKLLFEFGSGSSLRKIFNKSLKLSLIILILMIIVGPIIIFFLKLMITTWLPLYVKSLPLMSVFYAASIFISSNLSDIIYQASNRPILMFYQNMFLVILAFLIFTSIASKPIIWFAYAVLILQILKFISSLTINFILSRD